MEPRGEERPPEEKPGEVEGGGSRVYSLEAVSGGSKLIETRKYP
jgi:hypothetical protein